jgi:hypothetical protein
MPHCKTYFPLFLLAFSLPLTAAALPDDLAAQARQSRDAVNHNPLKIVYVVQSDTYLSEGQAALYERQRERFPRLQDAYARDSQTGLYKHVGEPDLVEASLWDKKWLGNNYDSELSVALEQVGSLEQVSKGLLTRQSASDGTKSTWILYGGSDPATGRRPLPTVTQYDSVRSDVPDIRTLILYVPDDVIAQAFYLPGDDKAICEKIRMKNDKKTTTRWAFFLKSHPLVERFERVISDAEGTSVTVTLVEAKNVKEFSRGIKLPEDVFYRESEKDGKPKFISRYKILSVETPSSFPESIFALTLPEKYMENGKIIQRSK